MEMMHKGMQMMKNMDAEGNGEISKQGFVQAHEMGHHETMEKLDRG